MERLKNMKNTLMSVVEGQLGNLQQVDTEELGQAIDMIKDLEEAMYYCSIVKAMEKAEEEEKLEGATGRRYYHSRMMPLPMDEYPYDRDMDRGMGRMYYSERQPRNSQGEFTSYRGGHRYYDGEDRVNRGESANHEGNYKGNPNYNGMNYYTEREIPTSMRDHREGRSPMSRRMYMESKELHKDKTSKMKDLEKYMKELTEDIIEMIEDASPEEHQILEKKMTQLTSKIAQLNV